MIVFAFHALLVCGNANVRMLLYFKPCFTAINFDTTHLLRNLLDRSVSFQSCVFLSCILSVPRFYACFEAIIECLWYVRRVHSLGGRRAQFEIYGCVRVVDVARC